MRAATAAARGAGWRRRAPAARGAGLAAASWFLAAAWAAAPARAAPGLPAPGSSALSLGPRGVQTLVAAQLFERRGRWYLSDDEGVCYTYLESPHVRVAAERLVLKAHLVARLGQRFGNNCVGTDLQSDVAVSGKIRGSGHQLILDDIRIDRVDDEAVRTALDLARQVNPDTIPKSVRIDILEALRQQAFTAGAFAVHVEEIRIASIATRGETVVVYFDLNLSAP